MALFSGVAGGLAVVWAFINKVRNDIEAPLLSVIRDKDARIIELQAEVRRCLEARADDAMTTAWNGDERRHQNEWKDKP